MSLEMLKHRLQREVPLTAEQWAFASLLGEARRNSNRHRSKEADREEQNEDVDLHGALGELLLFGIVRDLRIAEAVAYMRSHLYVPGGGRDARGPDLIFHTPEAVRISLDVKTFDCSRHKGYFAINDDKHRELAEWRSWYIGLICPPYAATAYLTSPIPYQDVDHWECFRLKRDGKGNPSRNLPIEDALSLYTDRTYDIDSARRNCHRRSQIVALARHSDSASVGARLAQLLPQMGSALEEARSTVGIRRAD